MSGQHAPLAPSSAPLWGECSGFIAASQGAPDIETDESREGDAAHWVMAESLATWRSPSNEVSIRGPHDFIGAAAPNGVVIDDRMATGAKAIVDDVLRVTTEHGGLERLLIEHKVKMPGIHDLNYGTLDVGLVLPEKRLLFLWDYKHGHRENSARGNLQLVDYTNGLMGQYGITGLDDQHYAASLRIVQPYCYKASGPVDEWAFTLSDLRAYANKLHNAAYASFHSPRLSAGLWCRDCPAVGKCAATRRSSYNLIMYADQPYEMDAMDGHDLAAERDILTVGSKVIKERLEAIEDELHNRITNGDASSGLTLETNPGTLKWTVPEAQAVAFAGQFQLDISKTDVITPTQAIAKIDVAMRPAFKSALKAITARPAGGLKLVNQENSLGARAFKPKVTEKK